jgi:hypothetical protein
VRVPVAAPYVAIVGQQRAPLLEIAIAGRRPGEGLPPAHTVSGIREGIREDKRANKRRNKRGREEGNEGGVWAGEMGREMGGE